MTTTISTRRTVLLSGLSLAALAGLPVAVRGAPASPRIPHPRIDRLVAAMTLEEKIGQLGIFAAAVAPAPATAANPATVTGSLDEQAQRVRDGRVGALFNGSGEGWTRR